MTVATYLTPTQLATELAVAKVTLAKWRRRGFGPKYLRVARNCIRYRRADVEVWTARVPVPPPAPPIEALAFLASLRDALRTTEGKRLGREIRALLEQPDEEEEAPASTYAARLVAGTSKRARVKKSD